MRKVLSFVLVLTLVLSSFSMAFAAETTPAAVTAATTTATSAGLTDISASANNQAIQVANNLGIVTGNPDGTFQPEKAVTRAEFAAMITRALGIPDSALKGYTATSFKDTTGYSWAVSYLAFCQSKGIMLGDGAGNAMPGRTINTNEAATMILRALGYTSNSSALVGVWPSNYVSMAQDLGIYDDTAAASNVDKQNAAQMIYNALTVQKVQVAADGTTTQMVDAKNKAVSMLTSGLGCSDEGYKVVTYDADAVINTVPYIGQYAKVYKNSAGDIIAIDDVQGTSITAEYKSTTGAIVNGAEFEADDVTYTLNVAGLDYVDKNDKSATPARIGYAKFKNGDDFTTAMSLEKGKTYTFNVGLSNKSVVNLYSIEEWTPSAAAKIVAGDLASIKDGSFLGSDFATDKSDKIISKSFELVGAKSLDDIKADSVVYVYEDTDREEISKVAVGTAVVEGTVTKTKVADKEWTIAGKTYSFSSATGASSCKDELNSVVKLYLDADGDVYKYDVTSGSAKNYATVVTYDMGGTADGNMKIYMGDDSKKTYPTDIDNWTVFENQIDAGDVPNAVDFGRRLIGYSLSKDGDIDGTYPNVTKAGAVEWGDNPVDGWYQAASKTAIMPSNTVLKQMKVVKNKANEATTVVRQLVVDPDAVVFTYETAVADGSPAAITGVSKVSEIEKHDTNKLTGQVEALVRDGKVVALIVSDADCSGTATDSYAVISGTSAATNLAGDKGYELEGFIDGKKIADASTFTSSQYTITGLETVEVYKLKYNSDKDVSKMDAQTAIIGTNGTITGETIAANGYTSDAYIKTGAAATTITAIASNAVYYEVVFKDGKIDEYKTYNGTIYAGMKVWMFETNDDYDGADIIIIDKGSVTTYAPKVTLGASTITATSPQAITTSAVYEGFVGTVTVTDNSATVTASAVGGVLTFTPSVGAANQTVTVTFTDDTTGDTVTKDVVLKLTNY